MPTCALSGRPPQLQDKSNLFLDKNVQAQIVFSLLTLIIQGGGSAPWQGMDHQCSRVLRQPRVLQKKPLSFIDLYTRTDFEIFTRRSQ